MIDAYLDWKSDLHTCGWPLSTSLMGAESGLDEGDFESAYRVCLPCMAVERGRAAKAKSDKRDLEQGIHPESWRLWHAGLTDAARAMLAAQTKT